MKKPSKYQARIFDYVRKAVASGKRFFLMISAVAGSGKTTTIAGDKEKELASVLDLLPRLARILFIAFGRNIAKELDARTPENIRGRTFNSAGHSMCYKFAGKYLKLCGVNNTPGKTLRMLWELFPCERDDEGKNRQHPELSLYRNFVTSLVSLAKGEGIGCLVPDEPEVWQELVERHNLELDRKDSKLERGIAIAREVLALSNTKKALIDFDDQVYLPILRNVRFDTFDYVIVDETQDLNPIQLEFVKRLLGDKGSLVVVGDVKQSIYGFRGANAKAMEASKSYFGIPCDELSLSISYRISKAVAEWLRQTFAGYVIEAADNAPQGSVSTLDMYNKGTFQPSDVIICRNVAPLVSFAYALIARGVGCKVYGRDIGEGLIALIQRLEAEGLNHLLDKLQDYESKALNKASKHGNGDKAQAVEDQCQCLRVIISTLRESEADLAGLIAHINALFSDDKSKATLTLCTAHKSKGLEWERVFILDRELIPSKYALAAAMLGQEWQLEQESNLLLVAGSRAKRDLTFISSGAWDEAKESKVASAGIVAHEYCPIRQDPRDWASVDYQ